MTSSYAVKRILSESYSDPLHELDEMALILQRNDSPLGDKLAGLVGRLLAHIQEEKERAAEEAGDEAKAEALKREEEDDANPQMRANRFIELLRDVAEGRLKIEALTDRRQRWLGLLVQHLDDGREVTPHVCSGTSNGLKHELQEILEKQIWPLTSAPKLPKAGELRARLRALGEALSAAIELTKGTP